LWNLPLVMLPMNAFCFSESACARLSENAPLAENVPLSAAGLSPPNIHCS
jgi:hypothetical protein